MVSSFTTFKAWILGSKTKINSEDAMILILINVDGCTVGTHDNKCLVFSSLVQQ